MFIIALVHGEKGAFGVSFPDFPGCASGGASISEALRRAPEALASHLEAMADEGFPMPEVRELDTIRSDPEFREGFADAVLVAAIEAELPGRASRLNISMDEHLIARIDKRARELGESRSGFLAAAAKLRLANLSG
jgi:predicted RNase H-like HicB family nuclease